MLDSSVVLNPLYNIILSALYYVKNIQNTSVAVYACFPTATIVTFVMVYIDHRRESERDCNPQLC